MTLSPPAQCGRGLHDRRPKSQVLRNSAWSPRGRRGLGMRAAAARGMARNTPNRGQQEPANARGTVTAEFAVALPAVLALLAMLLAGAAAGMTQLRIEEGARAGARALARGDDPAAVERTVRVLAGGSAAASVAADGEWFTVTVTDHVPGPLGSSIPWTLTARASTRSETAGTGAASGTGPGPGGADGRSTG